MKIQYNFRVDKEIIEKFKFIAEQDERTVSQQLTLLMKKEIKHYEDENGHIDL